MLDPEQLTIQKAHELLSNRQISSVELTRLILDRISNVEGRIKAYIVVMAEQALADAKAADDRIARGDDITPLTGVPVAVKDNLLTAGVRTTCASRMLEGFIPPHDATVVARLKAAGAVMVGKTNLDEFAMGSSTENSAFFPTRNPWDIAKVPGGSSGGSAAAVAAGEAVFGLGSDTGGSVRLPASFCGVVGLKPTYGRVSRYGLVAFASSLDQIGPITKTVRDAALVMNVIAGGDYLDSTSSRDPVPDFAADLEAGVPGLKVGVPQEYFEAGIQPEVEAAVRKALDKLVSLGAILVDISLPHTRYAVAAYYVIAPAEASANLARYDGVKYGLSLRDHGDDIWDMYYHTRGAGFGPEVKRRIMLGTYALSAGYYDAYYLKAQKVRTLIKQDFDDAFTRCDVVVTPTAPAVAFGIGERTADPLAMYQTDVCTVTVNQAGIPGLSIPCGLAGGLPVGLQILGKAFDEQTVLRVGNAYEQAAEPIGWPKLA